MTNNKFPLIGVGLRPTHYPYLETRPKINTNWFEALTENYINTEGRPLEMLLKVRADYPMALHGVSLSIGSDGSPDKEYLRKLKRLIERVNPLIVSDHLCWTRAPAGNSHDLLPLPLTIETQRRILENIDIVQSYLEKPLLLENISYYLRYKESNIDEADFTVDICRKSGCKILLDINNVYVNSINHGFNAISFIDRIPNDLIGQLHLAGPSHETGYLFDTHSTQVPDEVWELFKHVMQRGLNAPVIVEWDQDIPEFGLLDDEVKKAQSISSDVRR